jgi:hypothetical protein
VEHWRYAPTDAGIATLGHLGFFRPESREVLWHQIDNWLARQVGGSGLRRRPTMP